MDADNFPTQTGTNDMAKGNSQKKSDRTAPDFHRIDAKSAPNMIACVDELPDQNVRWKLGMPPVNNANLTSMQHTLDRIASQQHMSLLLANG
jgi:hypothetical protein